MVPLKSKLGKECEIYLCERMDEEKTAKNTRKRRRRNM